VTGETPRFCREAQSQLPALEAGELSGWTEHVVRGHLRRCVDCSAELDRQRQVAVGLDALRDAPPAPPPGLLDDLLARADAAGRRERVAVPVRGAVSGARPGLSIAFLTVGAAASTGVGYAMFRGIRAVRNRGAS
jgi:hypothetical protein